ncbi:HAMP domain-containing protein [bacterium]|nr:HAMP domain-containing protein [bacterium]
MGLLILLSVMGSAWTLFRVGGVSHALDGLRSGWIPLGKSLGQLATQSQAYQRELERSLGYSQWKLTAGASLEDGASSARFSVPHWLADSIRDEIRSTRAQLEKLQASELSEVRSEFEAAINKVEAGLERVEQRSDLLSSALVTGNLQRASEEYPKWNRDLLAWVQGTQKIGSEWDRLSREVFLKTKSRIDVLRNGLQLSLLSMVLLSFVLLWFAERALGPLSRLSQLAREIKRRGLRREDKDLLSEFPIQRRDEVSDLAREFHSMATALLERERVVQEQTMTLEAQNRELRELSRLRERLREAESLAAIGRLSAQVAHEVRNPLHSIGLEAELAIERAQQSGDPQLRQSLQSILESVERLSSITDNYLRFSKTSSGRRSRFDLGEALESVLATYAPACEKQGVRVDWRRIEEVGLEIHGDRDGVEQALGNLMSNALHALDGVTNPKIQWTLGSGETGSVWVRVRDNGPGIASEIQARLFAPFSTTKAQGTGLGLSWVKRIVDEHQGKIEVEAGAQERELCGASFLLIFPSADRTASLSRAALESEVQA